MTLGQQYEGDETSRQRILTGVVITGKDNKQ
jgi:hypothetical protein